MSFDGEGVYEIPLKGIHTDEHRFRGTTPRVDLVLLVTFSNVVRYHRFVDVFQHDDIVLVTLELELRYRPFSLSSSGNPSFRLVILKMIDIGIRSFRILFVLSVGGLSRRNFSREILKRTVLSSSGLTHVRASVALL